LVFLKGCSEKGVLKLVILTLIVYAVVESTSISENQIEIESLLSTLQAPIFTPGLSSTVQTGGYDVLKVE
jgi:hypothetical protein